MEKFFLRGLLFRQKLNVVDDKHVDVTVFVSEIHTFLRIGFALTDSRYKVARELFAGCVKNVFKRVVLFYVVCDSVHYVRFSETRSAVNEQRVIAVRRVFGNGFCRSVKVAVGRADHERIECVFGVYGSRVDFRFHRRDAFSRKIIFVASLDVKFDIRNARTGNR